MYLRIKRNPAKTVTSMIRTALPIHKGDLNSICLLYFVPLLILIVKTRRAHSHTSTHAFSQAHSLTGTTALCSGILNAISRAVKIQDPFLISLLIQLYKIMYLYTFSIKNRCTVGIHTDGKPVISFYCYLEYDDIFA